MMSASSVNILLIEDSLAEARFLQELLKGSKLEPCNLIHVKRLTEAVHLLTDEQALVYDVILLDLTLPDSQGLESMKPLLQFAPSVPIVVLTNTNDDELALEAVRQGAQDYLVKRQVNVETLVRSLRYAIERKQAMESLREVNQTLSHRVKEQTVELVKAKEQHQLTSEFVSMMSHDFRNPLSTILLSTELLRDWEQSLSKEQKSSIFQRIRSAGKSLVQLLDEVILVGQADVERLECLPTPLDLESFCQQLVEEARLEASSQHQVELKMQGEFAETLWDESLLRHIFSNLFANAIKYSPQGGIIRLEVMAQDNIAIFDLIDHGIGIPPHDLVKLFQAFHRASNVGKISGTGLGLAIVQRCVEAHGGEISVESEVGVSTTFSVQLPLVYSSSISLPEL
ncbi:hybrid sensor histidine kinase/response regulator [Lyngbya sp. PCC 8106]|uniref:hybrid sensor histidine kinase/response regulator n=1 Tax=Lyngbya sp. (strain PCC 8106) TaxID=313612 RepID=UPI0000EA9000|nr:hybrid sensor histidine kinase/response regulator [Lyngbya sp. PCC 8106]EAW34523.1 two-component hybrid sensor and regulator [Lyngbya sp. PCC 8106]